jgi:Fe-S-cluster containining protein
MIDHCKDCGLCCKKLIIEITHVDVVREPSLLPVVTLLDGNGRIQYDDDFDKEYNLTCGKPCAMLVGNRCSIYPTRPNICIQFEVGGEQCNELREENGMERIQ